MTEVESLFSHTLSVGLGKEDGALQASAFSRVKWDRDEMTISCLKAAHRWHSLSFLLLGAPVLGAKGKGNSVIKAGIYQSLKLIKEWGEGNCANTVGFCNHSVSPIRQ